MVLSNEDFAREVTKFASPKEPFEPTAYYDRDGDCIEFLAKSDDFYAERVDGLLTVYRSRKDNKIIGSVIKGVSHLYRNILQTYPGFAVEVRDGKVRLAHLFRARLWSGRPDEDRIIVKTYQTLAEFAEEEKVETEMSIR